MRAGVVAWRERGWVHSVSQQTVHLPAAQWVTPSSDWLTLWITGSTSCSIAQAALRSLSESNQCLVQPGFQLDFFRGVWVKGWYQWEYHYPSELHDKLPPFSHNLGLMLMKHLGLVFTPSLFMFLLAHVFTAISIFSPDVKRPLINYYHIGGEPEHGMSWYEFISLTEFSFVFLATFPSSMVSPPIYCLFWNTKHNTSPMWGRPFEAVCAFGRWGRGFLHWAQMFGLLCNLLQDLSPCNMAVIVRGSASDISKKKKKKVLMNSQSLETEADVWYPTCVPQHQSCPSE